MIENLLRTILCITVVFLVSCGQPLVGATKASAGVNVGNEAPNFSLKDLKGNSVNLKGFRGEKIVVLDFWRSDCPPCRKAIPELNRLQKDYAKKDVQVLGINIRESVSKVISVKTQYTVEYPILLDVKADVARDYRVRGIPNLIVIDTNGIVQYNGHGPSSMENVLKKLVK